MSAQVINVQWVARPEEPVDVTALAEEVAVADAIFREEMRRAYWYEALNSGMTTVEAVEYACLMTN